MACGRFALGGNYLYYEEGKTDFTGDKYIYKIKTNGKGKKKILKGSLIGIKGKIIYYQDKKGKYYSADLNGHNVKKFAKNATLEQKEYKSKYAKIKTGNNNSFKVYNKKQRNPNSILLEIKVHLHMLLVSISGMKL